MTFVIMTTNSAFMAYFCLQLFFAFREESNFVKRFSTTCSLRCLACCTRCSDRLCPTCKGRVSYIYENRQKQKELRKNAVDQWKHRADRHKAFDGTIWSGLGPNELSEETPRRAGLSRIERQNQPKKALEKRKKERDRRIKMNRKAGNERALQMVPLPVADEFSRRARALNTAKEVADQLTATRLKSVNSLQSMVTRVREKRISETELVQEATRNLRRAGQDSGDAGFLSGYHVRPSQGLTRVMSGRKAGKKWLTKVRRKGHSNSNPLYNRTKPPLMSSMAPDDQMLTSSANPMHQSRPSLTPFRDVFGLGNGAPTGIANPLVTASSPLYSAQRAQQKIESGTAAEMATIFSENKVVERPSKRVISAQQRRNTFRDEASGWLYTIDPVTGESDWVEEDTGEAPINSDSMLDQAAAHQHTTDPVTGESKWVEEADGGRLATESAANTRGRMKIVRDMETGKRYSIDLASGQVAWLSFEENEMMEALYQQQLKGERL